MSSSTLTNTLRNSGGGGGRILLRRCGLQQDYCSSQKGSYTLLRPRQTFSITCKAPECWARWFENRKGEKNGVFFRMPDLFGWKRNTTFWWWWLLFCRLLKSAKQSGQQTKPKKLTFQDTSKMRSFNTTLLENLTWVLYSPKFQSIITGKGFVLTKVHIYSVWRHSHSCGSVNILYCVEYNVNMQLAEMGKGGGAVVVTQSCSLWSAWEVSLVFLCVLETNFHGRAP